MFGRTGKTITAALVAATAAVPAGAAPQPRTSPTGGGYIFASAPGKDYSALRAATPTADGNPGFQWGDAGIGALAVIGVMGIGSAAVAGTRRRTERQPA
jgi:hypothetical protein